MSPLPHRSTLEALPTKRGFRLRGLEMSRLETFTDAAFAFALTLLVISLDPPTDMDGLMSALQQIPAFLASATLLMMFWWGHHEWSRRFGLDDGPTVVLSCVLVFTVLVYVVPLRFMSGLFFHWLSDLTGLPMSSGDLTLRGPTEINTMFAVYGLGFVAMSGAIAMLNLYALRKREELQLSPVEAHDTRADLGVWLILSASGGASAAVALTVPPSMAWLPGWVYMVLPIVIPIYSITSDRQRKFVEETAKDTQEDH